MKIATQQKENEFLNIKVSYNQPRKAVYIYFTKEQIKHEDGYNTVTFEPYESCNFSFNLCEMTRLNTKRLKAINDAIEARLNDILPLFLAQNKNQIVEILRGCIK